MSNTASLINNPAGGTRPAHTPGPWKESNGSIWRDVHPSSVEANDGKHQFCIAHCAGRRDAIVMVNNPLLIDDEVDANARLIAAAPALLAALDRLQSMPNDPRAHRQALDALALAKGVA